MGAVHLRHHRRPQDGGAHPCRPYRRDCPPRGDADKIVWGTFYDIRRYGGLQILLRALIGGASLVLSDPGEPVADFLARLGEPASPI